MSRGDARGYKIVYKTKSIDAERPPAVRQHSSRGEDTFYETRNPALERQARVPSAPSSRDVDRGDPLRGEYSETYEREGSIIVVETPRRRSPDRHEVSSRSAGARRRELQYDYQQPGLVTSRTMDAYVSEPRRSVGVSGRRRAGRYDSDDSDEDDRPRGRRDLQRNGESPPRRLKSAMRGSQNNSPDRRRARSVSFREKEASKHDVGNQFHQAPGAEARLYGKYLRHDDDDDLASETYATRRQSRRDS